MRRSMVDRMLDKQEKEAWAAEYARIDAEYYADTVPTEMGRAVLEASERAWATGKGGRS